MKRLPSLSTVEAFVQTARLGSVKAAAEALALSSPALTRRVQALERHVGHALFERRHQAVHLNAEGERLLAEIAPALETLTSAIERAAGSGELMRLKLAALPLFASHQLMPRLPK
ncbi:MAG TPA: LysR family transcriptional regulator, partial [Sphingomicrobium sp.]